MRKIIVVALTATMLVTANPFRPFLSGAIAVDAGPVAATPSVSVGPQYDTTHVYVAPADFDRFTTSIIATFGGSTSKQVITTVTPTPSSTISQLVLTPVGTLSVFGFKTPVPYPFGRERTGYLVTDMDAAVRAARADCADVIVAPFNDPIGRDVVIQFPGGVNMQLYWHRARRRMLSCRPCQRIEYTCPQIRPTRSSIASSSSRMVKSSPTIPARRVSKLGDRTTRIGVSALSRDSVR